MTAENDNFEALLQQSEKQPVRELVPGEKIQATIVGIDGETIFLDVGLKSEGVVESSEFRNEDGELTVTIGDRVTVYFLRSSRGEQLFTASIGGAAGSAQLEEAWRAQIPITGVVKAEIKGGFEISISGATRAFCPYSQMGLRRVDDAAAEYLETTRTFLITRFDENGRNIVVSARAYEEEMQRQRIEELKETLHEGMTVTGTIAAIRDFGLFVDIGGVDGLVPLAEIGWSRTDDVQSRFQVGQGVEVAIKGLDWDHNRISLSIKETLPDPWEQALRSYGIGTAHIGRVSRLAPFGAFVTLEDGIDGLVHISKLGQGRRLNHPREAVEEGQALEVVVESVDPDSRRISLTPSDYESAEDSERQERQEVATYQARKQQKPEQEPALGTLGALLKAKLDEKKS